MHGFRSASFSHFQKLAQIAIVWLVPGFGLALVVLFTALDSSARGREPDATSLDEFANISDMLPFRDSDDGCDPWPAMPMGRP